MKNKTKFKIYKKIPLGWKVLKGAMTAPNGYIVISNNESWFTGRKKFGIIKTESIKENLIEQIEDNLKKRSCYIKC